MRIIKVYRHGVTAGKPPAVNSHKRALRGDVEGWSKQSTRSNLRFLYSVEYGALDGLGFAITLTVRDCPPTHTDWQKLRKAFLMRLSRLGMIRCHWVTEWQRRGVPHLHGAIWFPVPPDQASYIRLHSAILSHWLDVASQYRAGSGGQHVVPISDIQGWSRYLAKHATRGVSHYQRSADSIPPGWKKTGRVWGYGGSWALGEPSRLQISDSGYWVFRRIARNLRVSLWRNALERARTPQQRKVALFNLRRSKAMLTCHDRQRSELQGISQWMEEAETLQILAHVAALGHVVES